MRTIDVQKAIAENPAVDKAQFTNVLAQLKELRKKGIEGAKYNVLSPFAREPAHVPKKVGEDPRTAHLRR